MKRYLMVLASNLIILFCKSQDNKIFENVLEICVIKKNDTTFNKKDRTNLSKRIESYNNIFCKTLKDKNIYFRNIKINKKYTLWKGYTFGYFLTEKQEKIFFRVNYNCSLIEILDNNQVYSISEQCQPNWSNIIS